MKLTWEKFMALIEASDAFIVSNGPLLNSYETEGRSITFRWEDSDSMFGDCFESTFEEDSLEDVDLKDNRTLLIRDTDGYRVELQLFKVVPVDLHSQFVEE